MPDHRLESIRRALVIGIGRSGIAAARALAAVDVEVIAADAAPVSPPEDLDRVEIRTSVDDIDLVKALDEVDVVVPSPAVPEHSAALLAAEDRGLPVWSEPELGWRLAPRRLVGITGTNGKTTVTEMVTAMLAAGGVEAVACGNIGSPLTTAAVASAAGVTLVAELSSFQLRFASSLRPEIGVLLNLAPDHLDWHGDMGRYVAAKARMWQAQKGDDWAVGAIDDRHVAEVVRTHAPGRLAWSSAYDLPRCGVGVAEGELVACLPEVEGPIVGLDKLAQRSDHHRANFAAAACAALLAGAGSAAVAEVAQTYRSGRHRLELVAEVGEVRWINDSKATNAHAAVAALRAVGAEAARIVWIAGGLSRGDLDALRDELAVVRHAVLVGQAASELAAIVAAAGVGHSHASSIEDAVRVAARAAKAGDAVLLAPACASLDEFRDYAERGERFAAAVRQEVTGGD